VNFRDYIIHISQFYLWYFLLKELEGGCLDGTHGVFYQPMTQYADEAAAEEFDKQFPLKEKLKLPGQLV